MLVGGERLLRLGAVQSDSVMTESVMGLKPLLFIADRVSEVLGRTVQFYVHGNPCQYVQIETLQVM